MFGDHQRQGRQIKDLTTLGGAGSDLRKRSPASLANLRVMDHGGIGLVSELQGASGMSRLASRGTIALAALGFGVGLLKPIGGGGLTGVMAIFAETIFELFDACAEDLDRVLKGVHQIHNGVGSLVIEGLNVFSRQHILLYETQPTEDSRPDARRH
jgi:hypothetical protein